jgi:RNA polymerase I-specific transcription initiation factor RRN3
MLLQNLPHKTRDRGTQCLYLRAVLALAEGPMGAPLREGLLLGLVDHLLSLDVEIKWEDIVDVKTGGHAGE